MPPDLKQLHQLCRLRSTLEAFAVAEWRKKRAADPADQTKEQLQELLGQLHHFAIKGDYEKFHEADRKLHRVIIMACDLGVMVKTWELVVQELDSWILHVQQVYWPSLMSLYREHIFLLEAWDSAEDWVAEEATHQHLEAGWYRLAATEGNLKPEIDPVDRAASFISTHFASHIDIAWIASHVSFISVSHLTRLFRKKLGVSPNAFLKQVRLEKAAELLGSCPAQVAVITHQVGYKNVSHFVRDFRKHFGVTPLAYRRK